MQMNNTPQKIKKYWQANPVYKCDRFDEEDCSGGLTKEHALIYSGKQIQELWAILDICEYHHAINKFLDAGNLDKKKHKWVAISRMTDADKLKYNRRDWNKELQLLEKTYGKYENNTTYPLQAGV